MKTKRMLLIPSAILCLVALSSCGKSTPPRFVNGFESPELEEYFKLPNNLKPVDVQYGMEVIYPQAVANVSLARSNDAVVQVAGNAPFFDSKKGSGDWSLNLNSKTVLNLRSPFSSSAQILYGASTTTKYDDDLPVAVLNEEAYRSTIDAKGKTNISNESNYSYTSYIEKNPDIEKTYEAFTITKGTSTMLSGGKKPEELDNSNVKNPDIAYKERLGKGELNDVKALFDYNANLLLLKNFQLSLPMISGNMLMLEQYCNLGDRFNLASSEDHGFGIITDNLRFYSKDDNTIYANINAIVEQGYVASPAMIAKIALGYEPSVEELIPAYRVINMVAKFTRNDINQWYCNYAGTNNKVFVSKDENLSSYSKPRCLCSTYLCSSLDYTSKGTYGPIEKVAEEYSSTKYGISVDIYNDADLPDREHYQSYLYDSFYDTTLDHVGGIYDNTMTFKTLGYDLKANQHVLYGTFDFNSTEYIEYNAGTEEEPDMQTIPVDDIDFDLRLVDRTGGESPFSLISEITDKTDINIDTEKMDYESVKEYNLINVLEDGKGKTYEFLIYFSVDNSGSFTTLDRLDIRYYSDMSGGGGGSLAK